MILKFEHTSGLTIQLDISYPYSIKEDDPSFCRVIGMISRGRVGFHQDLTYTEESKESLEARIAKLKHDSQFTEKLNKLIND